MKPIVKLTEGRVNKIISECIKDYICEGYWDDETDPVKLAEMYKKCVSRFNDALKTAIQEKGGLENIKQGDVILIIRSLGWRYYDSEEQALKALKNKYYIPQYRRDPANCVSCFFRYSHHNHNHEYIFVKGDEKPEGLWGDISEVW